MKALFTDPAILISAGIIVVGIFGFVWAFGKFRRLAAHDFVSDPADELIPPAPELPTIDFRAPSMPPVRSPSVVSIPTPAVSKDVADRLESMTQRLSEMQAVLVKQSSTASAPGAAAGGVGQGFSPETIDKLLKIIGNVIQQVDILQKNLSVSKEESAKPDTTGSPFTRI